MKKLILLCAAATFLLAGISCQKATPQVNNQVDEVVNVSLEKNQSYSYTLPESSTGENFAIASQQSNATSSIAAAKTQATFYYVPATDFTGTDVVVVSTDAAATTAPACGGHSYHGHKEAHHSGSGTCSRGSKHEKEHHEHHHGCSETQKAKHTITFNIKVSESVSGN